MSTYQEPSEESFVLLQAASDAICDFLCHAGVRSFNLETKDPIGTILIINVTSHFKEDIQ